MVTVIHRRQIEGFSESEAKILDFFHKKSENKPILSKTLWLHEIIDGVSGVTPKEIVKSIHVLCEYRFLTAYGENDSDNKPMYEITDAGLAAHSRIKEETLRMETARETLKGRILSTAHILRK